MDSVQWDPEYEQRLRDEVIYLHSLWHQGPPRPAASHFLQPTNAAHFKKDKRSRLKRGRKAEKMPDSKSSPGKEWACPAPPPEATSGWAAGSVVQPAPVSHSLSPEEQLKVAGRKAQRKALETARAFFKCDESDSSDDSGDESDHEFLEEEDERREYTFFLKVFMEDAELKEYYVENFVKGEFSCLVCGALGGRNFKKKFKGCLPLVQHSISIAKTRKRRAHRAYGQAVCKILSWDVDRLPAIVSLLSDHSCEALENVKSDNGDKRIGTTGNFESGGGNIGVLVREDSALGSEILRNTDHSSVASAENDTLEVPGLVNPCYVEDTVAKGLSSNVLMGDDANSILNGAGTAHITNVKGNVEAGLATEDPPNAGGMTILLHGQKEEHKAED